MIQPPGALTFKHGALYVRLNTSVTPLIAVPWSRVTSQRQVLRPSVSHANTHEGELFMSGPNTFPMSTILKLSCFLVEVSCKYLGMWSEVWNSKWWIHDKVFGARRMTNSTESRTSENHLHVRQMSLCLKTDFFCISPYMQK